MAPSTSTEAQDGNPISFIARPTPQLRAAIEQQRAILGPAELSSLVGAIRSAFEKYTTKLSSCEPGPERSIVFHQLVDRELAPAAQFPVTCRKGCSGCCHYEVEITNEEAELLVTVVRDGCAVDEAQLRQQAARERKDSAWLKLRVPENRCVFLGDDGACRVYAHRPAICRKHLVTSLPEACTTPGAQVVPIQLLLAEIIVSAALSLPGTTSASLPKMLLQALSDGGTI